MFCGPEDSRAVGRMGIMIGLGERMKPKESAVLLAPPSDASGFQRLPPESSSGRIRRSAARRLANPDGVSLESGLRRDSNAAIILSDIDGAEAEWEAGSVNVLTSIQCVCGRDGFGRDLAACDRPGSVLSLSLRTVTRP
ncbi:hypothetical protein EYF80_029684 [Liparis tanakae]|uniref:Uncharacterized protein n=1 Tax=Liparis tanakae TaxID=230148 RepID=A0A4Z2H5D2_9TELE|nr:hypothetical protein EYF80_029684 [Liparis tanakae]